MIKLIQNYKTGKLELVDVPLPLCSSDNILVRNKASVISVGTEKSLIDLGRQSLLGKARARPDLVRRLFDKAKKEGFLSTFREALERLDNPVPLGYSSAGVAVEAGRNVHAYSPGDRVACVGAGYASHAEYVSVPVNLCCRIPEGLSFEEASFGMLGIIALHGVRCAEIGFGEKVAIIGLGLLGLLTAQILKAYGCVVVASDIDSNKLEMARKLGIRYLFPNDEDFRSGVDRITGGYGADAVIITAATKSSVPVDAAVDISRQKGRVVLVGVADIHPQRNEMWHKEVEILVSKAGGPGSLDPLYEMKGIDYPVGVARWTQKRNLEEFLRLVSDRKIDVASLISHSHDIHEAETVYDDLLNDRRGPYIGVILRYPDTERQPTEALSAPAGLPDPAAMPVRPGSPPSPLSFGVIGAGQFGRAVLLPKLIAVPGIRLALVATSSGHSAGHAAKKYGFAKCSSKYEEVIESEETGSIVILAPHRLHAEMVIACLNKGKHVFVEKPLCVTPEELGKIIRTVRQRSDRGEDVPVLMVGYNRRFSPHMMSIRTWTEGRQDPMVIHYRVNAGFVPRDHWVHSEEEGGSRVVGEICHFVDAMQAITRSDPVRCYAERVSGNDKSSVNSDNLLVSLKFGDGSVGNITYTASGDKAYSRERLEIHFEGKTIVSEDFRTTALYSGGKKSGRKTLHQELGHKEELAHFAAVVSGKKAPEFTLSEMFTSTMTVFRINDSLQKGIPVTIHLDAP